MMNEKETKWLIVAIVLFAVSFLLLTCLRWKHEFERDGHDEPSITHDTAYVTITDTIHDTIPPIERKIYLRDTIYVAKDSVGNEHDIILPITQNFYKRDGLYEAWVSGFNPNLDSIHVFNKKEIVTITNEKTIIQNKWRFSLEGGFFAHSGTFLPSVGLSITAPKKWSYRANISIPYKDEPIYSFMIGYSLGK